MEWTMREVDIALKKMTVRQHNAFALRACLHGHKVPTIGSASVEKPIESSPEKDQAVERALRASLAEKQREMSSGKS
jgi:hypothetical protein